ncbi:MAG TPA: COX15/CtaA family protein [Bacteroidia bacterium]|jgi:cytochrome c oxidase assembly protein subunit 15|nr:COX15/CtaA family protein [Bacteroidia bacterium]
MPPKNIRRFILTAQITLVFVYLVIIAGSVVRATGSGMGCPDWPKCFGKWVPPTSVTELPLNYKEVYAGEHHAVAEFNPWNTWTEYLNRLAGAILGILIFIQFLLSIKLRKGNKWLFRYSLIELFLIGFQGWLGAKVVSSNLAPLKITIHMVVALVILSIAILIIYKAKTSVTENINKADPLLKRWSIIVFIATIYQIMMGTQVREEVDVLLKNFDAIYRSEIIGHLSNTFITHRSFAIAITLLNAGFIFKIHKNKLSASITTLSKWLGVFILIEIMTGIILSRFALPASAQPTHLLLACIIYGLQWMLILNLWKKQQTSVYFPT